MSKKYNEKSPQVESGLPKHVPAKETKPDNPCLACDGTGDYGVAQRKYAGRRMYIQGVGNSKREKLNLRKKVLELWCKNVPAKEIAGIVKLSLPRVYQIIYAAHGKIRTGKPGKDGEPV